MKPIHTSLLDTLINYIPFTSALEILANALEFGFFNLAELRFNLFDYLADYMDEEEAKRISREAVEDLDVWF